MSKPLPQRVAQEIRAELARQGMTQVALAAAIGKTQNYVMRRLGEARSDSPNREAGTVALDVADLELIARALKVPVSKFLASAA